MRLIDYTLKLSGITDVLRRWQGVFAEVDERRRERIARYADAIADTLARANRAFETLERKPSDKAAQRVAIREFGRLGGYIESIVATLEGRIDGRRLAGIKRRLEGLALEGLIAASVRQVDAARIERIAAAEGYFRALADGLRARA